MKINNYVKIRGAYVPTSSLTKEEWLEVSGTVNVKSAGVADKLSRTQHRY